MMTIIAFMKEYIYNIANTLHIRWSEPMIGEKTYVEPITYTTTMFSGFY